MEEIVKNRKGFILLLFMLVMTSMVYAASRTSSRLPQGRNIEHLIITPAEFAGVFQRLAEWRTEKGVPSKVITTEFIRKNYRTGDMPKAIRSFLKDAYKSWGVKYVLLGGDTEGRNGPLIPVRYARSGMENTDIPSDLYYSDLTGSWNGNGNRIYGEFKDNVDLKPELMVGRASVDTLEEASNFIAKVLRYEKKPPKGWVKRAVLAGAELDEVTMGERGAEILAKKYLKGFALKKFYHLKGSDAGQLKAGMSSFNPHFVYVAAHGNQDLFAFNGYFKNKDADELSNNFPFIYTSISCLTNYFDKDSLSEHMMNNPNGGAVAYWACSREGWYQPRNEGYFYSVLMIKDFYNLLFNDPKNVSNNIGHAVARARAKYIPEAKKEDGCFRWLVYGMNLLGDPEMPVWTSEPKKIAIKVLAKDLDKRILSLKVVSGTKGVAGAKVAVKYYDDKNVMVTATGKNCIPLQMKIACPGFAGIYSVGKTNSAGSVSLSLKARTSIVNGILDELVSLDEAIKELEAKLKKMRSNQKLFAKISRDYDYLVSKLSKRKQEIRKFFIGLVETKNYKMVEKTLDVIEVKFKTNPGSKAQFAFVLKAIKDKMSFKLAHLGQNPDDIQSRIFHKIMAMNGKLSGRDQLPQEQLGRIKVTSTPAGAQVFLNNIPKGKTPCAIEGLPFGQYTVKIKAQGYKAVSSSVNVNRQKTIVKNFSLAAGCSVRGKVTFGDTKKPAKGAKIGVYEYDSKTKKWITHQEVKLDDSGRYSFKNLPKRKLYVEVQMEGYNGNYKPFMYDARDQGFQRTWNVTLYPLCTVKGKVAEVKGADLKLFHVEKHGTKFLGNIKVKADGSYAIKDMELGVYKLIYTVPGKNICVKQFHITKGKDKVFNLKAPAIKTVGFWWRNQGGKFNSAKMEKNEKGVYEGVAEIEGSAKPYQCFFMINYEDYSNGGPLTVAINPSLPAQGGGLVSNFIKVTKNSKIKVSLDTNRNLVYYVKAKDKEGKVTYQLSAKEEKLRK